VNLGGLMAAVSVVEWLMLAVLLVSALLGVLRGLVYEVLSLLSWVAAFVVAQVFAQWAAVRLPIGASDTVKYPLGFALVFVLTVFAGGLIAWIAKKLVKAAGLSPMDRTLGAAFGLMRGVVMLLAATALVSMTSFKDEEAWRQSVGAGVMTTALKGLKPVLPEKFGRYLPD
jgi:membrane protein required for colicin V production